LEKNHLWVFSSSKGDFLKRYCFCGFAGATAAGVPGEVKGFYEAWKKYGKLDWADLVQPSINMTRTGFSFGHSAYYAATRAKYTPLLKADPGHRFEG